MGLTAVPLSWKKRTAHNYFYLGRTMLGVQRCGPWYLCLNHLAERRFHTLDDRLDYMVFRGQLTGGSIPRCCGSANTLVWDVYIDGQNGDKIFGTRQTSLRSDIVFSTIIENRSGRWHLQLPASNSFIKSWKTSAVSTTDWIVETQLCKLCRTSDTFLDVLILHFI